VTYCIVSVDGRNVAVPWQALDVRGTGTQIDRVTLNVDRERLRNAPTVQRDRLNVLADERFTRDVHQFYGAQPNQIRTERFEYRDTQRWEDTRPDRRDFDRRLELHDQRDFDARYEGRYDARIDAREGRARFEAQHDPSLRSPGERDVRYRETWDVRDRRFEDHHDPRMRTPGTFREDQYRDTRTYDREWEVRRDYDTRWDDTQWNRRTWRDDRWVDDPRIARPGEAHPGGYGGGIMDDRTWDRRDRPGMARTRLARPRGCHTRSRRRPP
jgi:hypothetical protein